MTSARPLHSGPQTPPRRIALATANPHKVREMQDIFQAFGPLGLVLDSASSVGGMPEVEESGDTFADNAFLKAEALRSRCPDSVGWVLADDSGLEVGALGGRPGVHSARYAGPRADASANNARLLAELGGLTGAERSARFVCHLCLLSVGGERRDFVGSCEGLILEQPVGSGGFGYDPLFLPHGFSSTYSELADGVKNAISHRARAVRALLLAMGWWRPDPIIA